MHYNDSAHSKRFLYQEGTKRKNEEPVKPKEHAILRPYMASSHSYLMVDSISQIGARSDHLQWAPRFLHSLLSQWHILRHTSPHQSTDNKDMQPTGRLFCIGPLMSMQRWYCVQLQNSLYNSLRGLRKQKHLGST